jgi:hypothetical protein
LAESKTAKNRAKRQKKKARARVKGPAREDGSSGLPGRETTEIPIKKRRLVSGKELVFRKPGQDNDDEDGDSEQSSVNREENPEEFPTSVPSLPVAEEPKIIFHEDAEDD